MLEFYRNNNEETYIPANVMDAATHYDIFSPTFVAGDVTLLKFNGATWDSTDLVTAGQVTSGNKQVIVHLTAANTLTDHAEHPILIQFIDQGSKAWEDLTIAVWVKPLPANLMCINALPNAQAELIIKNLHIQATSGDAITLFSAQGNAIAISGHEAGISIKSDSNGIDIDCADTGIMMTTGPSSINVNGEDIIKMLLAMVNGNFAKDFPSSGDITFYDRDGVTELFVVHVTDSGRTRY